MTLHHSLLIDRRGKLWNDPGGLLDAGLANKPVRSGFKGKLLIVTDETAGAVIAGHIERGDIEAVPEFNEEGARTGLELTHAPLAPAVTLKAAELRALADERQPVTAVDLPPSKDKIRAEASRRMMALLGARDRRHLDVLISNNIRAEVRLLRKGKDNWDAEDAARAEELERLDDGIEAIRAKGNAMEADPPEDFEDDKRWWDLEIVP